MIKQKIPVKAIMQIITKDNAAAQFFFLLLSKKKIKVYRIVLLFCWTYIYTYNVFDNNNT